MQFVRSFFICSFHSFVISLFVYWFRYVVIVVGLVYISCPLVISFFRSLGLSFCMYVFDVFLYFRSFMYVLGCSFVISLCISLVMYFVRSFVLSFFTCVLCLPFVFDMFISFVR